MSKMGIFCPEELSGPIFFKIGVKMEWCNDGEILAVTGFVRLPNLDCRNELRFYTTDSNLRYKMFIPHLGKPVTALTWGHNNKRLFVAVGCYVYTAWVTRKVPLLQFLCRREIQMVLKDETSVSYLPLPTKLRNSISALFSPTIKGYIPDPVRLREFVCMPPRGSERLHCTMIRHGDELSGGHYTLYLEYLGGIIPLLKGKRASKIRPEFVIFDPKIKTGTKPDEDDMFISSESTSCESESDEDVVVEGCGSPRMQRKKRLKKIRQKIQRRDSTATARPLDELLYDDNLPEAHKLMEVTSNLWGTKFKLHGLASYLPEDLGQVLYKTSLLHLQPRQMTVSLLELTPDLPTRIRDPSYNPNQFSESDDDIRVRHVYPERLLTSPLGASDDAIPISPEGFGPQPTKISQNSTEALLTGDADNGAIEVPVIIERHATSVFQSNKQEKCTNSCSPFEIRSLDGSPPQRRSPSLRSRSLSPAEQQVTYTSNTLVDCTPEGEIFTREMYIDKSAKVRMSTIYDLGTEQGIATEITAGDVGMQTSPCSVVHLAAKRLEDVLAKQRQTSPNDSEIYSLTQEQSSSQLVKNTNSTSGFLRHSATTSDGQQTTSENTSATVRVDMHRISMSDCPVPSQAGPPVRWADKASHEIKYIDDEQEESGEGQKDSKEAVFCAVENVTACEIVSGTGVLIAEQYDQGPRTSQNSSDIYHQSNSIGSSLSNATNSIELHKKRLVLAPPPEAKEKELRKTLRSKLNKDLQNTRNSLELISRCERKVTGIMNYTEDISSVSSSRSESPHTSAPSSPVIDGRQNIRDQRRGSLDCRRGTSRGHTCPLGGSEPPATQSTSLPTSPVRRIVEPQQKKSRSKQDISMTKSKLYSPFLKRRFKNYKAVDSSDEEILLSSEDVTTSENYKNLETFQKAQLHKKLRKVRTHKPEESRDNARRSPSLPRKRHFVMHNKAPLWNENSQVYQLDFGGRVTQESAKNFQIEFRGKQVMQFGRIDGNAYTLDFQYPFSAIQAFAVALANVTQRLK